MHPRLGLTIAALSLVSFVAGCGDDEDGASTAPAGSGGAGAAANGGNHAGGTGGGAGGDGGDGAMVEMCNVGDPIDTPAPGLDGMDVTIQVLARLAPNIVQVGSARCTEGLRAALLEVGPDDVLLQEGTESIFCGCPSDEHALCPMFEEGALRQISGKLSYEPGAMCNQVPCYAVDVQSVCEPPAP